MRGVSEIVSALLLLLIVSAIGFAVYLAFLSQSVAMSQAAERMAEEARVAAFAGVQIVAGFVQVNVTRGCGDLHLYLVANSRPADVIGVYVEDEPVYPNVTANYDGCVASTAPRLTHFIPGYVNYTVIPLTVPLVEKIIAEQPKSVRVKVVTRYNADVKTLRVVYVK